MNNKKIITNITHECCLEQNYESIRGKRPFKQTSFCDEGPGFSKEANAHLDYYWIQRGCISSHPGAMNLNTNMLGLGSVAY